MRIGALCLAAVAAALLMGCGPLMPRDHGDITRAQSCSGPGDCDLEVTITENSDGTCEPVVKDLRFTGGDGERTVVWKFKTADEARKYEFSRESYKFAFFVKDNPRDQFKSASTSGQTLTLKFNHKATGREKWYEYLLAVKRKADGTFCETKDPWLIS